MNKSPAKSKNAHQGRSHLGLDSNLRTEKPTVVPRGASEMACDCIETTTEHEEGDAERQKDFPAKSPMDLNTSSTRKWSSQQRRRSGGAVSSCSTYSINPDSDYSTSDMGTGSTTVEILHKPAKRWSLNHRLGSNDEDDALEDSERGHCVIEDIRGKFGNAKQMKPKWKTARRSSLSSMQGSLCSQTSMAQPFYAQQITDSLNQGDDPYRSSSTLPVTNVVKTNEMQQRREHVKKEQMIESLVWFSFHIPRTILEDLIAHELSQWNSHAEAPTDGPSARRSKRLSKILPANYENEELEDGSVSSLSGDEATVIEEEPQVFGTKFSERAAKRPDDMLALPTNFERKSALLFVDMSGFTKLSRMLDVESLSKVINTYFDMIVSEVILFGGDILKFAGDAFFAEWRILDEDDDGSKSTMAKNPLSDLNASLVSIGERAFDNSDIPPLSNCVLLAAKCGASIVKKFSDYQVTTASGGNTSSESMLNLHCGIGVGDLVGLHVGDYREDVEESVELRREFLLLGEPIDQVSIAADVATDGQVFASSKAMQMLTYCCDLTAEQRLTNKPVCIAARDKCFLQFDVGIEEGPGSASLQPYESLRIHCQSLKYSALQRLNLQMALYVHPVIRADELALSAAIRAGKISQPTETLESRHRAEAELRSVFTMFISPQIKPRITGMKLVDDDLFQKLNNIMYITSRELDRYSGHLRQFIVDDKGVVLIATFGLRGSTFPNMVENNCLPATFAIQRSLTSELGVETRIGATFGKVYCGVVGGVRRHEFACMGAPVNLAARLMSSKVNNGILVDEAVREQCQSERFAFKSLPPVEAKGYDRPVPILEPTPIKLEPTKRKNFGVPLVGRRMEKRAIQSIANGILDEPEVAQSTMVFITGESGVGKVSGIKSSQAVQFLTNSDNYKTALAQHIMENFEKENADKRDSVLTARSTSTETEQRIPLRLLMSIMKKRREACGDQSSFRHRSTASFRQRSSTQVPCDATSQRSLSSLKRTKRGGMFGTLSQSVHGVLSQSIHSGKTKANSICQPPPQELSQHRSRRCQSLRPQHNGISPTYGAFLEDDSSESSSSSGSMRSTKQTSTAAYFELICWACEELDYPFEYADIVGSQFLGFEEASAVTHIDGYVPSMDELVEFLALVFVKFVDSSKLVMAFVDDFQWVDAFSWRVLRVVCKRASNVLLMCATRSHDKQALRRITNAAAPDGDTQSQMIEISLGPFDFNDIKELISYVFIQKKTAISDSLCAETFQMTGGVPVYAVQLLENLKRTQELQVVNGVLVWKESDRSLKNAAIPIKNGAMMEETFLSRFDCLDVRVRKVLQSCAVWGLSFELGDVAAVHLEMKEEDIEEALDTAVDEMILIENVEDVDDDASTKSGTHEKQADTKLGNERRYFQFSHSMWRKNVLATMLKERKVELHRLIAESIERKNIMILQEGDISQLLTLLDHWKSCGEFCKVVPLALAAGVRLEEWELPSQSLELYEDALEMVFGGVETASEEGKDLSTEWVKVKAKPLVLDLILRLHVCAALSHQQLGSDKQSILLFEDAYNVIKTASKLPRQTRALKMPIISSLCVLKLEYSGEFDEAAVDLEDLIRHFVEEAKLVGTAIHIGRSLSMWAVYQARLGDTDCALATVSDLLRDYDLDFSHDDMVQEYGRDFAIESLAESSQWLYLLGRLDEASQRAIFVIENYLTLPDPDDLDSLMPVVFPVLQILVLVGEAKRAKDIFQEHVLNPYQADQELSEYWNVMFRPFSNLIDLVVMEESENYNKVKLRAMESWVLEQNNESYEEELRFRVCTVVGEICWRLSKLSSSRAGLLSDKAREMLVPVARYEHDEVFQKQAAQALLESL